MKFARDLISDTAVHQHKLGEFATRSTRSDWATQIENIVRSASPFPISYDVTCTQPTKFTEYCYTEFHSGVWLSTQSMEINTRMINDAAMEDAPYNLTEFVQGIEDKYVLDTSVVSPKRISRVCFLPGHNMLDVASVEIISRIAHEEDDVYFKPHPITNDESMAFIGSRVGWNRVIPKDVSGNMLLQQCDEVFTTTASEMAVSGTALGKHVVNVSNFFTESAGTYYPISRVLFQAHQKYGITIAQQQLSNVINCKWSGFVFPWQTDVEERINNFYTKSLEYRERYRSLSSPIKHNEVKR